MAMSKKKPAMKKGGKTCKDGTSCKPAMKKGGKKC